MASAVASSSSLPSQPTEKRQQPSTSSSSHTRNPVALRLYKVLSTNFEDAATREALQTLSDLYAPLTSTSAKGKEPVKPIADEFADDVDDDEDEDEDVDVASHDGTMKILSGGQPTGEVVPGEIAARARKHLRRDMEKKLAEGSRQFLKALGEVDQVCVSLSLACYMWLTLSFDADVVYPRN